MGAGLATIVGDAPRVLLLGSFPSEKALRTGEYYANARNQFWALCAELFATPVDVPYSERVAALCARGVALWDVLQTCQRGAAPDFAVDMQTAVPNDLRAFVSAHPSLRMIGLSGATAARLFLTFFPDLAQRVTVLTLPSSRGAHEPLSFAEKVQAWSALKQT